MQRSKLFIFFIPCLLFAQKAQMTGRISDATEAVIPGAKVTVTSMETGALRNTRSNEQGYYTVPLLLPGNYRVSVASDGFRPLDRSGLKLEIDQVLRLDFVLEVGAVTERVEVTAAAPLLQAADASLGTVVSNRAVSDYPLNGRSFQDLLALGAGAVPPTRATRTGVGDVSVSGLRVQANNYVLDGADNNSNIFNNQNNEPTAYTPPPDALNEFKVGTNSYSAEYGRGAGAVISATLKSGSNEFRGSAYEFLRNDNLDARNFFATRKGELIRNQFGGTVGGPIRRNRTFFFFSFEGTRVRTPGTDSYATVPTAAAKQGDFPGYNTIVDPTTRAPFPGNRIPAGRLDPVSRRLSVMWPEPNLPGIFRNYLGRTAGQENRDKFDWRFDQNFSERDTLFFRFSLQQSKSDEEDAIPLLANGENVNRTIVDTNNRSAAFGETHTFSPTTINEFRAAFHWTRADRLWGTLENLVGQFQIPGLLPSMLATPGLPNYNISGVASIGGQGFRPNLMREQTLQFSDSVFHIHGAHTLKAGGEFRAVHIPFSVAQRAGGEYVFTGDFTRGGAGTGAGAADFLLGYPQSVRIQNRPSAADMRRFVYAAFVNDDWKISNRFTANLGLRYEFVSPLIDSKDKFSSFDPGTGTLRMAKPGGLASRSLVNPDYMQFAPRIGLAYRALEGLVIRAGYGMFFSGEETIGAGRWLQNNPDITFEANIVSVAPNPLVTLQGGLPPNLFDRGASGNPSASGITRNARTAYAQHWNFTIQHTPWKDWSLQAAYVGTKGSNFLTTVNLNQAQPGAGAVQARRPYPSLGTINYIEDRGKTIYHGLQTQAEKRFSAGLNLLASYTWSKAIDDHEDMYGRTAAGNQYPVNPRNLALERSLSGQHIGHRLTYSMLYELPFGRGRAFAKDMPAWANLVLGGWDLTALTAFFSGSPFSVQTSVDACGCGLLTGSKRPDRLRDGNLAASERTIGRWFDKAAFAVPERGTLGNSGRNVLISPGTKSMNFSVMKNFRLRERYRAQFRVEFFNFPNHPNFGIPGNNIETPGAGIVTDADPGRQIQFGLKVSF